MGLESGRRGALCLVLGLLFAPPGVSIAAGSADDAPRVARPRTVVEQTVRRVLDVLEAPDLALDQRRQRIEAIAFEVFDFTTVSKLVLARNWKKLDQAQRRAFMGEFKQYLSRNYGRRLERYEKSDVEITGARVEPRKDVTVLTRVVGSQYDGITMNYRMRLRGGEWKVIDIVIEGVSMLANFRSQFAEVVSREGVEGLLAAMRERNANSNRPN